MVTRRVKNMDIKQPWTETAIRSSSSSKKLLTWPIFSATRWHCGTDLWRQMPLYGHGVNEAQRNDNTFMTVVLEAIWHCSCCIVYLRGNLPCEKHLTLGICLQLTRPTSLYLWFSDFIFTCVSSGLLSSDLCNPQLVSSLFFPPWSFCFVCVWLVRNGESL